MTQQQYDMLPVKIINPNDDWFLQIGPIDVLIRRFEESEVWDYDDSFRSNDEPTSPIEEEFVIKAETCDVEEIGVQHKTNGPTTTTTHQLQGETTPAVCVVHMLHEQQPAPAVSTLKRPSRVEQNSASSAVTTNQHATQQWILEAPMNHKMQIGLVQQFRLRMLQSEIKYIAVFDATIDAFVSAMEREGFEGILVVVTETGWPTGGGGDASPGNALAYNGNIIRRAMNNVGTPKRPGVGVEAFLFGLFDENDKAGEEFERHFGIFTHDGLKAYDLNFK
ncbi:hypothetical protein GIB67_019975 [Kingdonia uniflora]|uniref:Glucan endo-1,3-beta-D-glucosidase n=1 Tax=Kingdonia uniflora TaxID=39325 RepID=A0A7J7MKL8_9MAGN|nr:hypothetical protein GIB67_019975 [Kingdonia uniflora]